MKIVTVEYRSRDSDWITRPALKVGDWYYLLGKGLLDLSRFYHKHTSYDYYASIYQYKDYVINGICESCDKIVPEEAMVMFKKGETLTKLSKI